MTKEKGCCGFSSEVSCEAGSCPFLQADLFSGWQRQQEIDGRHGVSRHNVLVDQGHLDGFSLL